MTSPWNILALGGKKVAAKNFPKALPLPSACPSLLYGVELEIENVPNWPDMVVPGITSVADGSLRNNGREFITNPMSYSNLAYCLDMFFTKNKLTKDNYSERCSIHVHTNCLDLTMDQIKTVLFLYQMCEKVLYSWVDPERYDNIFCVPWSQTNITYQSLSEKVDPSTWKAWRKYTGLNLLPLYEHGTIEWRHMSGHSDVKKILEWCQIIGCMFSYALEHSLEEVRTQLLELNTNSQYQTMLERVFKDHASLFYSMPTYIQDLEDGVLNLKYAAHTSKTSKSTSKAEYGFFAANPFDRDAAAIAWPDPARVPAPRARALGQPHRAGRADELVRQVEALRVEDVQHRMAQMAPARNQNWQIPLAEQAIIDDIQPEDVQ